MPESSSARVPLIALFIYLFAALYGPGWLNPVSCGRRSATLGIHTFPGIGPIPSIYFSEAFPPSYRELGAAFTICVNNAVGSVLSLIFPPYARCFDTDGR